MVLDNGDSAAEGVDDAASALLDDVGEFVAEQELSVRRVRIVLPRRKMNVGSPGKCDRSDARGLRPDMNADVGKVCP